MSTLLTPQEKILEFLRDEFSRVETEYVKQKVNKKLKPKIISKMARKLYNDIELILKTSPFESNITTKILELKKQVKTDFLAN